MKRRSVTTIVVAAMMMLIMVVQLPVTAQAASSRTTEISRIDLLFYEDEKGQIQANPGGTGYAVVDIAYEKPIQVGNIQVKVTVVPMVGYAMNNLNFDKVYVTGAQKNSLFKDSIGRWVVDVTYNVKDDNSMDVTWSERHPGKVTWNKVSGASSYLVEMYYAGWNGERYGYHTTTTARSADLCEYLYKNAVGSDFYVRVTAMDKRKNVIDSGQTCWFEEAEFKMTNSFWNSYNTYEKEFYKITGWSWGYATDNWVCFLYYYDRNHEEDEPETSTPTTTPEPEDTLGWKQSGSVWYYYDSPGHRKNDGWFYDGGYWYYLQPDGKMRTGWLDLKDAKYFFRVSGQHPEGAMVSGWQYINSKWYYFYPSNNPCYGQMAKNCWAPSGKDLYYVGEDGVMLTGWVVYNEKWVYIDPESGAYQWDKTWPY